MSRSNAMYEKPVDEYLAATADAREAEAVESVEECSKNPRAHKDSLDIDYWRDRFERDARALHLGMGCLLRRLPKRFRWCRFDAQELELEPQRVHPSVVASAQRIADGFKAYDFDVHVFGVPCLGIR